MVKECMVDRVIKKEMHKNCMKIKAILLCSLIKDNHMNKKKRYIELDKRDIIRMKKYRHRHEK